MQWAMGKHPRWRGFCYDIGLEGVALWRDHSVVCKVKLVEKLDGKPFLVLSGS